MLSNDMNGRNNVEIGRPAILALMKRGRIDAKDVAELRRTILQDRSLSRIEVEDLYALDAVLRPRLDAWTDFFVEAVTDHVVWDMRPTGTLDEQHARWLIERVDVASTVASFAVLVNILDEAHRVPRWFDAAVRKRAIDASPGFLGGEVSPGLSA